MPTVSHWRLQPTLLTALCAALSMLALAPAALQADNDDSVASRPPDSPQPPTGARKPAREAGKPQPCAASGGPQAAAVAEARPNDWQRRHRVSRIIGKPLCGIAGEQLGVVQDVVIDRQGRVAYGVVALGGFAEAGGKLFLVPWRELKPHAAYDQFVLDIPPERLLQAPAFDANDWPDITDKRWAREVYRFYAQRNGSPRAIRRDGSTDKPAAPALQPSPADIAPMGDSKAQRGTTQRTRTLTVPLQPTRQESEA